MTTDTEGEFPSTPQPSPGPTADAAADPPAPYRPKIAPLWNNFITMAGLFISAVAVIVLLTFALFSAVTPTPNPYIDIVGYLVVPSCLIFGVATIPFGILIKSWRVHRRHPEQHLAFRFPRVDLNDPVQRRAAKVVIGGTFVLLPVVGVSSYHGYHYTDSSGFCGKACHAAMHPQATTYEHSAHARVACAECHIGEGAGWFVKSKLSGTRQVLAMWRDSFSRPIAPAIQHLRPARETCEHCHWPKKFFGAQLKRVVRFSSDEANTRHEINMLLKTGGGDETTGRAEGIHSHMALGGRTEYVATDDKLQVIPWVKYIDEAGSAWIYRSDGRPSSDPRPVGALRELDCMDCHNRPAHKFRSPQDAVDVFLDVGEIDPSLPFIKREAVEALLQPYPDQETANTQIANRLIGFYKDNYPHLWETRESRTPVNKAVDEVREIYARSFFPAMKVDWQTYPDNIGHHNSPGCFRCHEGKHVNQRGEAISHECSVCHTFLNPVKKGGDSSYIEEGEFIHPFALEGTHAVLRCDQCHTGGLSPPPTCAGCHADVAAYRAGTLSTFEAFSVPPEPMADSLECVDCHDLSEPTSIEVIDVTCMDCHEDEEQRFTGMLASWKAEAGRLLDSAAAQTDEEGLRVLEALRKVGPLHNIEATRGITEALSRGRPSEGSDGSATGQSKPPES